MAFSPTGAKRTLRKENADNRYRLFMCISPYCKCHVLAGGQGIYSNSLAIWGAKFAKQDFRNPLPILLLKPIEHRSVAISKVYLPDFAVFV